MEAIYDRMKVRKSMTEWKQSKTRMKVRPHESMVIYDWMKVICNWMEAIYGRMKVIYGQTVSENL